MVAMTEIQDLAACIARDFQPERIILFGSYANGNPAPDSDVDLLVIMAFEGKPFWKSLEIANRVNPRFPTDVIVRRPDDTARRYEQGDPLIRDAIDCGNILYERCNSGMDNKV